MDGSFTDEQVHLWLQEIADEAWISLHYDSPGLGGIGLGEIEGGGYTRAKVPMSQPANRTIWSLADARFAGLIQNQLVYFGIWDSEHNGLLRAYGRLPGGITVVLTGNGYVIPQGDLAISFG